MAQMTDIERQQHREAMRRYRAKYPEKQKKWNKESTSRRRAKDPAHMKSVKDRSTAKRDAFIETLKLKPCMDCNGIFPPCVMEFDHVRGKKHKPVSQLRHNKMETLLLEVAKCDLVCSNCHRMRTHKTDRTRAHARFNEILEIDLGALDE